MKQKMDENDIIDRFFYSYLKKVEYISALKII